MPAASIPLNEADRIAALKAYEILDTPPEQTYDDIVMIAAEICGTPIALISLIDDDRQWFKARLGIDASETPRDLAFCAHAIHSQEPLIVEDATQDARFAENPLVVEEPKIRFYAGAPLTASDDHGLGTLCVIDQKPRTLTSEQVEALQALARQVVALMELRRVSSRLAEALSNIDLLSQLVPICAYCKRIRDDQDYWTRLEAYLHEHTGAQFTHCICPECSEKHFPGAQGDSGMRGP